MIDILQPCPCGSGINYETCCQPHLLRLEKPQSAEKLLRSRYTAFVAGDIDYIADTHHPDTKKDFDVQGIKDWSLNSKWVGLEITRIEETGEDETTIEFCARYAQQGDVQHHHETSLFKRLDGTWYFYDVKKNKPIVKGPTPGRNEPCSCGSGKKFKKCCG